MTERSTAAKKSSAKMADSSVRKLAATVLQGGKGGYATTTPRGDVVMVQLGRERAVRRAPVDQRASSLLPKVGRALARPGVSHSEVFGESGQAVYAYSLDPKDPTKVVRENSKGQRTVGRVVNGSFRPLPAARA